MRLPEENIHKILVITLSNVGDCLLTLPVFRALRTRFPSAKVSVVVGERGRSVFLNDPRFEELFVYDRKVSLKQKIRFILELRKRRFDLCVDLRDSLFGFLVGARTRTPFFHRRLALHRFDRHLERLKPLGLSADGPPSRRASPASLRGRSGPAGGWDKEDLWIRPEVRQRMQLLLEAKGVSKKDPFVVVSPGSRSDLKRWGEKSYALLCAKLIREKGLPVLFVGEPSDRKVVDTVTSTLKEKTASLVGETSIEELAAVLRWAGCLVANDSATLHAATLVGCPTVAIFGPTDPKKYGPRGEKSVVVRKTLFCSPCELARCPYHHECMEELSVEEVYQACCNLLSP